MAKCNCKININVDMQDTCTVLLLDNICMYDIMLCTHVQELTKLIIKMFEAWYIIYEESEADKSDCSNRS